MFTGIIQDIGVIETSRRQDDNIILTINTSKLIDQIKLGDSVAVSGACLTVTEIGLAAKTFTMAAVAETLEKTILANLRQGDRVNLELALRPGDHLGGHFVQGHIDAVGTLESVQQAAGSWLLRFKYPSQFARLLIEKGSIAIDGVSLTAYDCNEDRFTVSVIPHTWSQTTLRELKPGHTVNLEFDMIGKYILNDKKSTRETSLTLEKMIQYGF